MNIFLACGVFLARVLLHENWQYDKTHETSKACLRSIKDNAEYFEINWGNYMYSVAKAGLHLSALNPAVSYTHLDVYKRQVYRIAQNE